MGHLRKLRGKALVDMPAHTRRYHVPLPAARIISALLTMRDHVIAPILAGVRSSMREPQPAARTVVDDDYQRIRIDMQGLFDHLGITAPIDAAA